MTNKLRYFTPVAFIKAGVYLGLAVSLIVSCKPKEEEKKSVSAAAEITRKGMVNYEIVFSPDDEASQKFFSDAEAEFKTNTAYKLKADGAEVNIEVTNFDPSKYTASVTTDKILVKGTQLDFTGTYTKDDIELSVLTKTTLQDGPVITLDQITPRTYTVKYTSGGNADMQTELDSNAAGLANAANYRIKDTDGAGAGGTLTVSAASGTLTYNLTTSVLLSGNNDYIMEADFTLNGKKYTAPIKFRPGSASAFPSMTGQVSVNYYTNLWYAGLDTLPADTACTEDPALFRSGGSPVRIDIPADAKTVTFNIDERGTLFGNTINPNGSSTASGGGYGNQLSHNDISNIWVYVSSIVRSTTDGSFQYLQGVFLTSGAARTTVPAMLIYRAIAGSPTSSAITSTGGKSTSAVIKDIPSLTSESPEKQQAFFIGDGVVTGKTIKRVYNIPAGADTLYLSNNDLADGYCNNGNSVLKVTYTFSN